MVFFLNTETMKRELVYSSLGSVVAYNRLRQCFLCRHILQRECVDAALEQLATLVGAADVDDIPDKFEVRNQAGFQTQQSVNIGKEGEVFRNIYHCRGE